MSKRRKSKSNNDFDVLNNFRAKTENQQDYIQQILENDIVFCTGPAGTGKTTCAVGLALQQLVSGKIHKIVITRPIVEVSHSRSEGLGFLPGDLRSKINPYLIPILDEMYGMIGKQLTENYIENDTIEIAPLEFMGGRTLNAFMILDEAQNASYKQLVTFITRMGKYSKAVINGDIAQSDIGKNTGFEKVIDRLEGLKGVGFAELETSDIQRNSLISAVLNKLLPE